MRLHLKDFKERLFLTIEGKLFQVVAPEKAKLFWTKSILANGRTKLLKRYEAAFLKEDDK